VPGQVPARPGQPPGGTYRKWTRAKGGYALPARRNSTRVRFGGHLSQELP
jgi:hypothetical protein